MEHKNITMSLTDFRSTHALDMIIQPGHWSGWLGVEIGTVSGLFRITPQEVRVLSVINNKEGNGQVRDFFEWMEHISRTKGLPLVVICVWNRKMERMLLENGFVRKGQSADFMKLRHILNP